jgi:hypothetical protein
MIETASKPSGTTSSWSVSRDQQLQVCERKYFFQYLAGGRLNGDTREQRQIGLLKKLKAYPLWIGDLFHRGIVEFFNSHDGGSPLTTERLIAMVREQVARDWRFSSQRTFVKSPYGIDKEGVALLEHYYDEMPPANTEKGAADQVTALLEKFMAWVDEAGLIAQMREADRVWIEPDAWGPEAPGFVEEGVQVITKVDLAFARHGEKFEIYDWKSGRAPRERPPFLGQHELQVGIYQLWPLLNLGVDLSAITSHLVYFGDPAPVVETHKLDEETLPQMRTALRDSVRLARQWEERFQSGSVVRDDLSYAYNVATCRQCSFRELCRQTLDRSAHA